MKGFIDEVTIEVEGGAGGDGCSSFRREKFIPRGGPDGGDGGRGGHVFLVATHDRSTLADFRYNSVFRAQKGGSGKGANRHGADGEDLFIPVPVGTIVTSPDREGEMFDLSRKGMKLLVARGGRGGRGNARFKSPSRRAPRYREKGLPGEKLTLRLELKLLADAGLVGFPNAGKSTLLSVVSQARPKIADYPFTTLEPNLGVVSTDDGDSFVLADIPGLIEGAHEGKGLGDRFLRHIERSGCLLILVDGAPFDGRDPVQDLPKLEKELELFSPELAGRKKVIAVTKADLPDSLRTFEKLRKLVPGEELFLISSITGQGIKELTGRLACIVKEWKKREQEKGESEEADSSQIFEFSRPVHSSSVDVEIIDGEYWVSCEALEAELARFDFSNVDTGLYFKRALEKYGIEDKLIEAGARAGDTIIIGSRVFEFFPESGAN